jgi:acyl-CoA dehydrogenase
LTGAWAGPRAGAAKAVGIARAALLAATAYVKECRQFRRPIASFQAIPEMLADAETELEAAWLLAFRVAWLKENGKRHTREASMAKVFASEVGSRVCQRAFQVLGEYGCMREYPIERHLRDIRVTMIYEGTSEIQRLVIARHLLRDGPGESWDGPEARFVRTTTGPSSDDGGG